MALIVQKYGGTSVGDIQRIRNVARRAAKTFDQGNDVVVILSAMSGVTDSLINLAKQVTDRRINRNWMFCWQPESRPLPRFWQSP